MGKLFIETVITRGRGDRVSFLPILSLRLSNELLSPERLLIFVRRIIFLLHRESGHNWTRAAEVLLRGGFSQFCGVTDEEWCCSRYLWVTSFGSLLLPGWHTVAPMNCYWASQRDHPPRKSRGHNQEQAFSRGRSDVFETSQFIPNCGQPPLLDVVCVPTQHSKHFWFQRASHSHHSQTFCHHFFLSFESHPPIPAYLYFALVL